MITSIRLQNYRSYRDESFEFEPGVNIVVGPNASGKTNLLEAVLVLVGGGSYRAKDIDLIKLDKSWSRLDGFFGRHSRSLKLESKDSGLSKTFVLDDKPFSRLSLERTEPVVFFEPNHLQLISRGPEARRDYIDGLLEKSIVGFKALANNYRRTLAQRNALLKRGHVYAAAQLFAWDVRLSELGEQIAKSRQGLMDEINKSLSKNYSQIAGRHSKVQAVYKNDFPIEAYASRMIKKLESQHQLDLERGFTGHGPHREDVIFYLNSRLIGQTASRGETRSLVLALKVYELALLEEARGKKPIFLLDDVFSELDSKRRHALVERLKDNQVIITTTDADAVIEYFAGKYNLIALPEPKR